MIQQIKPSLTNSELCICSIVHYTFTKNHPVWNPLTNVWHLLGGIWSVSTDIRVTLARIKQSKGIIILRDVLCNRIKHILFNHRKCMQELKTPWPTWTPAVNFYENIVSQEQENVWDCSYFSDENGFMILQFTQNSTSAFTLLSMCICTDN